MSLKTFHIVFLVLSTALALGFGVWATIQFRHEQTTFHLMAAVCAFITVVVLPIYGARFLRTIRSLART